MTSLSLIIPSLGRNTELLNLINDLSYQNFSDFEVLIINQGKKLDLLSNIDTKSVPFKIRFFYLKVPNASIARNIGALKASSNLLLLLDDDVRIADPGFLHKHVEAFVRSGQVGVYGQVLELGESESFECSDSLLASPLNWHMLKANFGVEHFTRNGGAGNLLLSREYYIAVGGMNRLFERGARREETEFNMRYTKKFGPFLFCPKCSLTHLSAPGGSRTWG
nr:glycosyltransferase [Nostoc sp. CHAB 5844]